MLNNGNNERCGFDDAMISYIYDEITAAERRKFETHMVDCSVCTDEFAEISGARFSVFEWQKEAFAELETPRIVIPYTDLPKVGAENGGFFAGLRGLFGGFGIPLTVAASLLICLGIGFAALTLMSGENQVASNIVVEPVRPQQDLAVEKPVQIDEPVINAKGAKLEADVVKGTEPDSREIKPEKAVAVSKPSQPAKRFTAETNPSTKRGTRAGRKAPALSNFEEADDRSLRLTDLFNDEIGSIR